MPHAGRRETGGEKVPANFHFREEAGAAAAKRRQSMRCDAMRAFWLQHGF